MRAPLLAACVAAAAAGKWHEHGALEQACVDRLGEGDFETASSIVSLIATGGTPDASLAWPTSKAKVRFEASAALLDNWWSSAPKKKQRKHAKRTRRRDEWLAEKADSGEVQQQLGLATVGAALGAYQQRQLRDSNAPKTGDGILCDATATLAFVAEEGHTDDTLAAAELLANALLACPEEYPAALALEKHARRIQRASEKRRQWPSATDEVAPETAVAQEFFLRAQALQGAGRLAEASATYAAISSAHRGYPSVGWLPEGGPGEVKVRFYTEYDVFHTEDDGSYTKTGG